MAASDSQVTKLPRSCNTISNRPWYPAGRCILYECLLDSTKVYLLSFNRCAPVAQLHRASAS